MKVKEHQNKKDLRDIKKYKDINKKEEIGLEKYHMTAEKELPTVD